MNKSRYEQALSVPSTNPAEEAVLSRNWTTNSEVGNFAVSTLVVVLMLSDLNIFSLAHLSCRQSPALASIDDTRGSTQQTCICSRLLTSYHDDITV